MGKPDKLKRKTLPPGHSPSDFQYKGRPAKDQGDFGSDVGVADGACVNQFGDTEEDSRNNSKYYHGGVVQSTKTSEWYVYVEWGRIKKGGKSWQDGEFCGGDFQFWECSSESEARSAFAKQLKSKNLSRLEKKSIGGVEVWVSKTKKNGKSDGYIIQSLATRTKGLPDAYAIKDDSGLDAGTKKKSKKTSRRKKTPASHPKVAALARDLVGGTQTFTRAAAAATGVTPTMDAIQEARDVLIPAALKRLSVIGDDIDKQLSDKDLQDLSKMFGARIPIYIPLGGDAEERAKMLLLNKDTLVARQQDLDAFEAALGSEDFGTSEVQVDASDMLGAEVDWIDPQSDLGRWLDTTFRGMTNNRHGYLRGKRLVINNMFKVERPDRDAKFLQCARDVAKKRKGRVSLRARLQPSTRPDVSDVSDIYDEANLFFGQHGTRSVNVHPIMSTNFRLPKHLKGVHITGANFGGGCYFSSDRNKATGYSSYRGSYWASGTGGIQGRGFFMFLCDVIMGEAYQARTTGSWSQPPGGKDSIAAYNTFMPTLQNDEHIIFDPNYQRIRYLMECDFR